MLSCREEDRVAAVLWAVLVSVGVLVASWVLLVMLARGLPPGLRWRTFTRFPQRSARRGSGPDTWQLRRGLVEHRGRPDRCSLRRSL
ncbi:MAG: hypothetical protein M3O70_17235 [Actinomycetota bacterium]|nr:hypothetical protein [Actinomycetota bacterium]